MPLADSAVVATEDEAIAAAERFGVPVALRADVPGLLRTSDARDVLAGARGADQVRRGFRLLQEALGSLVAASSSIPWVPCAGRGDDGSVLHEQVVGPLVLFESAAPADDELGGATAPAARLRPAHRRRCRRPDPIGTRRPTAARTPRHARRRPRRAAGYAAAGLPRMVDDLPQIAELALSPVIALSRRRAGRRWSHPHPGR